MKKMLVMLLACAVLSGCATGRPPSKQAMDDIADLYKAGRISPEQYATMRQNIVQQDVKEVVSQQEQSMQVSQALSAASQIVSNNIAQRQLDDQQRNQVVWGLVHKKRINGTLKPDGSGGYDFKGEVRQ